MCLYKVDLALDVNEYEKDREERSETVRVSS